MNRKSLITSISSTYLSNEEANLIYKEKPWGIILFKRNIDNVLQLRKLTYNIRKIMNDPKYPILVDEEGGNVSRFSDIIDTKKYSQKHFADIFSNNKKLGKILYQEYLLSICNILKNSGININTIPVLDILQKKTHKIIGNRSFSNKLKIVKYFGKLCTSELKKNKIGSVSKHTPGHGCSNLDTHFNLPVVEKSYKDLLKKDFSAFKNVNSNFTMTAHIIYKDIDPNNCATHSKIVINKIIRKKIGFKGLIISDDISMRALSKNILYNAQKAILSGCNLALYCKGNIKESKYLLKNIRKIDNFTNKKTSEFYNYLR